MSAQISLSRTIARRLSLGGATLQLALAIVAWSIDSPFAYVAASLGITIITVVFLIYTKVQGIGGLVAEIPWLGLVWGYAVKFFLAIDAEFLARIELPLISPYTLDLRGADALLLSILATMGTSAIALIVVARWVDRAAFKLMVINPVTRLTLQRRLWIVLVTSFFISIATSFLTVRYGIAVGGAGDSLVSLPFRLAGVVYWMRALVLPCVLGLVLVLAANCGAWHLRTAVLLMIAFHGVTMGLANSSRGAIMYSLLPAAFMWMFTRPLRTGHIMAFVTITVLTGLLHPIFTEVRNMRLDHNPDLRAITWEALQAAGAHSDGSGSRIAKAAAMAIGRYVGAEGALAAFSRPVSLNCVENYRKFFSGGAVEFSRVFTAEFAGYGYEANYAGAAPSLMGTAYLAGSWLGPPLLVPLYFLAFGFAISLAFRFRLWIAECLTAFYTMVCFMELGEGMVSHLPERLLYSTVIILLLNSWLAVGQVHEMKGYFRKVLSTPEPRWHRARKAEMTRAHRRGV